MTLNVTVKKRIATYVSGQGIPVCGNTGDQVKFTFDEEWSQHETKTARFKWGGKVFDQEFTGDICEIPNIDNTDSITVGVFVGEEENGEDELSTTDTRIPYKRSTRCGKNVPHSDSGKNYTNEAKGYAIQAQEAVANIEQYKGLEYIGTYMMDENVYTYGIITEDVFKMFSTARFAVLSFNPANGHTVTCVFPVTLYTGTGTYEAPTTCDICVSKHTNDWDITNFSIAFSESVQDIFPIMTVAYSNVKIDLYR